MVFFARAAAKWFAGPASCRDFWVEHANHKVAHHSSLLTALRVCKLIVIDPRGRHSWNENGERYSILDFLEASHGEVIVRLHKIGCALRSMAVADTLCGMLSALRQTTPTFKAFGLQEFLDREYKFPWLFRAY